MTQFSAMALLVLELLAAFAVPLATGEEGYCAAGQDKRLL